MFNLRRNSITGIICFLFFLIAYRSLPGQENYDPSGYCSVIHKSFDIPEIPEFIVEPTIETTAGYYIFDLTPGILIMDHFGNPLFFKDIPGGSRNFERQDNGSYSYYANAVKGFLVMNEYYQVTDTFNRVNGDLIDFHEFAILNNGNFILLGYDRRVVDMSQYVEGGKTAATVTGMVFQELDPGKNLLFEWNSWDHISFLESDTFFVHFKANSVDYVHTNSIFIDTDGNFLLSHRHLSEIMKIHRTTGDILWRMGGSQNEFTFIDDTLPFSGQHSAIRLPNGNIALLDNGNGRDPQFSRGVEYQVDEVGKTATLIRDYRESPVTYSAIMGNVAPMPNNHLVVGWGKNSNDYFISEYNNNGEKVTSIYPEPGTIYTSYKVSFLEEFSSFLLPDPDTLDFGMVQGGDSAMIMIELTNTGPDTATLCSFTDGSNQFKVLDPLPIEIASGGSQQISLEFQPTDSGSFYVPFYLNFQLTSTIPEEHLVASRLMVEGYCPTPSYIQEKDTEYEIKIYPNPFTETIILDDVINVDQVLIWSLSGVKMKQVQNSGATRLSINSSNLIPGIYVIEIHFRDNKRIFRRVVKM